MIKNTKEKSKFDIYDPYKGVTDHERYVGIAFNNSASLMCYMNIYHERLNEAKIVSISKSISQYGEDEVLLIIKGVGDFYEEPKDWELRDNYNQ